MPIFSLTFIGNSLFSLNYIYVKYVLDIMLYMLNTIFRAKIKD
jgi:hypothetical protein